MANGIIMHLQLLWRKVVICDTYYCDPSYKDVSSLLELRANRRSKKQQQQRKVVLRDLGLVLVLSVKDMVDA